MSREKSHFKGSMQAIKIWIPGRAEIVVLMHNFWLKLYAHQKSCLSIEQDKKAPRARKKVAAP